MLKKQFFVSTKIILFAPWLYHLVILEVHGDNKDDLKFWEPNPELDNRRIFKQANKSSIQELWNTREKSSNWAEHIFRGIARPSGLLAQSNNDHDLQHGSESENKREIKKPFDHQRPRKSKPKQRARTKGRIVTNTHKSTRITPMYMMQKQAEEFKIKSLRERDENSEQESDSIFITTYSLAKKIDDIFAKFSQANMTKVVIKRTIEFNDILLLKITEKESDAYFRAIESKYMEEDPQKKIIFIVHGLSVMGIYKLRYFRIETYLTKLLSFYLAHLNKFDIFLIPMANPDGFEIGGLWNKNMSPQKACQGVALDRNFDVAWNASKVINACSQHYPGPLPFSEPESQAIREVFHNYSHKIIAYLNVHSGTYDYDYFKGDAVLYPRGYTETQSDDDKYIDLKGEIDESLKNASFKVMSVAVDTIYNWYGRVYGTSVDYASSIYGIPYAMELVMQLYDTPYYMEHDTNMIALTEIWGRVINVIFNNIWKNTRKNDVQ